MNVLIVGAGEMGRWFATSVDAEVAFADVEPAAAQAAADATGGRTVPLDGDERFDVVCVAVPLDAATEAIEEHAGRAEEAVVDVTGSMVDPLAAMGRVVPDRERVSFHPLFSAAHAPGTVAVSVGASGPTTDAIWGDLAAAGNELVQVTAATHDEAMRTVQGRTHAAILAFALAADDVPEGLATPVFEELQALVDRVTGNTPRIYADIQAEFGGAEEIAEAAARIADADPGEFRELYEDAGR